MPYLKAFLLLSDSRSIGFSGPLPLSVNDIRAYVEGFTDLSNLEGKHHFLRLMKAMDNVWLELMAEKRPKNPTPQTKR